jgi:hypothetical protein
METLQYCQMGTNIQCNFITSGKENKYSHLSESVD